jgi:hypothetical protein
MMKSTITKCRTTAMTVGRPNPGIANPAQAIQKITEIAIRGSARLMAISVRKEFASSMTFSSTYQKEVAQPKSSSARRCAGNLSCDFDFVVLP